AVLKYADAKSVANVIKELFQQDTTQNRNQQGGPGRFFNFMRGGPGGQGGDAAQMSARSNGRAPQPRVTAVADERSNAVVVSAPEDQMPVIEGLIAELDQNIDEITELRVFHLQYADPQEMASLLTSLFPDPTTSQQGSRGQFQFGGGFGGGPPGQGGARGGTTSNTSERAIKQSRVVAVPDPRTRSVVVSAARNLMDQIAAMITDLDSDPARKQKVFVFDVQNSDPEQVQEILQSLFPAQNYGAGYTRARSSGQNRAGSQLNRRAQQNMNMGFGRNTGMGTTGFGNTDMRMGGQ
ncbi:MAG: secretin N-terminal domain-containing protein, partial [Verrucomicrobiota bacterium]|nr:secretin N-terminal domain-containing protein [Verrucomicrobiota bacterium]